MYVVIVARGYPSEKYKMNGLFEFDQAKALAKMGCKVVYIALDMRSVRRKRKWGTESFIKDGVYVEALNIPCGKIPLTCLTRVSTLSLSYVWKQVLKKYGRPDIIHSHFILNGYVVAKVFNRTMIPIVHTEHSSVMNQITIPKKYYIIGSKTYHRFAEIITVSDFLKSNLKKFFGVNSVVIPNIVDIDIFKYKNNNNHNYNKNKKFRFISVGGLNRNKRMDLLIKGFNIALSNKKNMELLIFGEGAEKEKIRTLIKKMNLNESVKLMGLVDRSVIAKELKKSDCFILVSKTETFGVAYIEAMAAGLPVISATSGGPEEFINRDNGLLLEDSKPEALAEIIEHMIEQKGMYDNKKISEYIIRRYTAEIIAQKLICSYRLILEQKEEMNNGD